MMIPAEYDEIRPYTASEIPQICEELIADPEFQAIIKYAIKDSDEVYNFRFYFSSNKVDLEKSTILRRLRAQQRV